jgi:hypothetical protein
VISTRILTHLARRRQPWLVVMLWVGQIYRRALRCVGTHDPIALGVGARAVLLRARRRAELPRALLLAAGVQTGTLTALRCGAGWSGA